MFIRLIILGIVFMIMSFILAVNEKLKHKFFVIMMLILSTTSIILIIYALKDFLIIKI